MIISTVVENGQHRICVTRFASVMTFFTANDDTGGVTLHVEPGFFTDAATYARTSEAVEQAVLNEVARRMALSPAAVLSQPFDALRKIADPPLPSHYQYARRSQNRAAPTRF